MIVASSSQYFAVRMVHWIVETIIETCNQSSIIIVSILAATVTRSPLFGVANSLAVVRPRLRVNPGTMA